MPRLFFVVGTRPEAVKLCPVIQAARARSWHTTVCATGQHGDIAAQVLELFGVVPDIRLNTLQPGASLAASTSRILDGVDSALARSGPQGFVVVQGDATSTLCGALAGFYGRTPVAHVEAGLRTGDPNHPYPEEVNRVLVGRLTQLHFAPTAQARQNLLHEGVPANRIWVTGNTGIDALMSIGRTTDRRADPSPAPPGRRLVLATVHRRENHGGPLRSVCRALRRLSRRADAHVVFVLHPNPAVQEDARALLAGVGNVSLVDPLDYGDMIRLLKQSHVVLTDSGGLQEESPAFGRPLLVLREKTERPEGVAAGVARLIGTDEDRIVQEAERLLDDPVAWEAMARATNPYGDGKASERICEALAHPDEQQAPA